MCLVVRKASKFRRTGWLTYDSVFCRSHIGTEKPWNYLDASLHQVYIASKRDTVVAPCKYCHEMDHVAADCTVELVFPKSTTSAADASATISERGGTKGKWPAPYSRQWPICTSWNGGSCKFPGKCIYAQSHLAFNRREHTGLKPAGDPN